MGFRIGLSIELREKCVGVFELFDELKSPAALRGFVDIPQLEVVKRCIGITDEINYDRLISKLLDAGRSWLEPALFDLLDALAIRYKNDAIKREACEGLKAELRQAIPRPEDPEQARDYQRLAESSVPSDEKGVAQQAQEWIKKAGDNLDEIALRIALAVFNGTSFILIEQAKNDLLELLQSILPPPDPDAPKPSGVPVPLMLRMNEAGAYETDAEPPDWKRVVELRNPDLASEAISYVWERYGERKWRQKLMEWLTSYATGRSVDVRTRAAVAAGRLAMTDYRFVRDNLFDVWVSAEDRQAQYRTALGMALGVLIREERWTGEVQSLLREWSESSEQAERWAAMRAYIYVGPYCRPVSEVITRWRGIAASEVTAVDIHIAGNTYLRLTNPLHLSLVDAMMRFFMNLAQLPVEEKRPLFASALEGLETWLNEGDDSCLGLFMFSTIGRIGAPAEDKQTEDTPVLLQLLDERPAQSDYRQRLAALFILTLRKAVSIMEAKELLCEWLQWIDSLQDNLQLYEARIQALLTDIIAADKSGGTRGQLAACLRGCGRSRTAGRVLARLAGEPSNP
jgi:hypothetical protein